MDEKRCVECGDTKPVDEFHRRTNRAGGRVARCKACLRAAYEARPIQEPVMDGHRTCRDCGAEKHVTEFPRHKREPTGRHQVCKTCHSRRERARRLANPDAYLERKRTVGKASELRRNYGLSLEDYETMYRRQRGCCAICKKSAADNGRHLCVDHDHACCPTRSKSCGNCVRGLLCSECNNALGGFRDDPVLLRRAIRYLAKP